MTMITNSKHVLTFGALDWAGKSAPEGWSMRALAEGASFGDAEPIEQTISNQLMDGSISEITGFDNRTATFDILIEGGNSIAVRKGAVALTMACRNAPTTLVWKPSDGLGVETIFEVVTAVERWVFVDTDDLRTQARYRVTLECLPFGKSPGGPVEAEFSTVASSSRQQLLSTTIEGSARTQGSLSIAHASNGLGETLVVATKEFAAGFRPNIMQYCTQSTSSSSGSVSGRVKSFPDSDLESPATIAFEFPASQLKPGSYQLVGRIQTGTMQVGAGGRTPGIRIRSYTKTGSTVLSSEDQVRRIDDTANGVFQNIDCGQLTLPTTTVPAGSSAVVRLEINVFDLDQYFSVDDDMYAYGSSFQEFWLIPLEGTSWSMLNCGGTGTAAVKSANSRVWFDSATLESRVPSLHLGTQADRSDAYHASVAEAPRWMPFDLSPGEWLVFVANSGGTNPTVGLSYDKRWRDLAAS